MKEEEELKQMRLEDKWNEKVRREEERVKQELHNDTTISKEEEELKQMRLQREWDKKVKREEERVKQELKKSKKC